MSLDTVVKTTPAGTNRNQGWQDKWWEGVSTHAKKQIPEQLLPFMFACAQVFDQKLWSSAALIRHPVLSKMLLACTWSTVESKISVLCFCSLLLKLSGYTTVKHVHLTRFHYITEHYKLWRTMLEKQNNEIKMSQWAVRRKVM